MAKTSTAVGMIDKSEVPQEAGKAIGDAAYVARLNAQPKRTVRIPFRDGIKQKFVQVWVNGHAYQIMRGQDVEVPKVVYDILAEAGEI